MTKNKKKPSKGKVKTKTSGSIASLISELFRTLPDKRYSVKNLITATGAMTRDEKDEVRSVVRSLLDERTIELVAEGKYRLSNAKRETFEGIVDMTSSGAFYVKVEGLDKDIYVNSRHAGHVLHGDRVKVAITRKAKKEMNPEGEVIEILEHSAKKYVGVLELSESGQPQVPYRRIHSAARPEGSKRRSKSAGTGHRMARYDEKSRG